jgi:hypothetical protein
MLKQPTSNWAPLRAPTGCTLSTLFHAGLRCSNLTIGIIRLRREHTFDTIRFGRRLAVCPVTYSSTHTLNANHQPQQEKDKLVAEVMRLMLFSQYKVRPRRNAQYVRRVACNQTMSFSGWQMRWWRTSGAIPGRPCYEDGAPMTRDKVSSLITSLCPQLKGVNLVGSDGYCSPRHRTPFDSINEGSKCV